MKDENLIEGYRLSLQQKHLWLQWRHSQVYRAQCVIDLTGRLQSDLFREALLLVVRRHEILRTTFQRLPEMDFPLQVIAAEPAPSYREIDLCSLCEAEQESEIEALFEENRATPFDLETDALLRCALLRMSANRHVLLVCLPALCADAATLVNLMRETAACYKALLAGGEPETDPVQYVDYVEWQRESLLSDGGERWPKQSLNDGASFALPYEIPSKSTGEFTPAAQVCRIDGDLFAKIVESVGREDLSISDYLLCCWMTLLWRLTRKPELIIGLLNDGRKLEPLRHSFGLFARYAPVECRFAADTRFNEASWQVGEAVRQALARQDGCLWEGSLDFIDRGGEPFFPFAFDYKDISETHDAGPLKCSIVREYVCVDRFKLKLSALRSRGTLTTSIYFDPSCYSRDSIEGLAERFESLVKDVTANPRQRIDEVNLLGATERRLLFEEWAGATVELPSESSVHGMFEAQSERTPDAISVVMDESQLSFGELNRRANQLAQYLKRLGVGPESPVGLLMERSIDVIECLLAILKAGGVYIPLDPAQPRPRLEIMIAQTRISALITADLPSQLEPLGGAQVVRLSSERPKIAEEPDTNLKIPLSPDNLAYVIFTSGSTGQPKGALIRHGAAINYARGLRQVVYDGHTGPPLSVSLNAPIAFDASIKQITHLLFGYRLVIIPEHVRRDAERLLNYVRLHNLEVLDCTPTHLEMLRAAGFGATPELQLAKVLVGGEAIDKSTWADLAANTSTEFFNHYGPTECTVNATICKVTPTALGPAIGRPIFNTRIFLADERLQPAPIGVAGELHISGEGLSRGYSNHPDWTAEKFIPDPFSRRPGIRMYRSGDIARYWPDGMIEYLGRRDFQVKVRGHRIELGEIEVAVKSHPEIRDAVATALQDETGGTRLVAYVVLRNGRGGRQRSGSSTSELRDFALQMLPDYMVPAVFVALDELPLTRNGKLDREALPAPELTRSGTDEKGAALPRTLIEEMLTGIWAQVLQIERVVAEDNFFQLGGHSLLATQLISRIRDVFQIDLPLRSMFETSTVAELAGRIDAAINAGRGWQAPPIEPVLRDGPLPLSFAQQRLWFLDQLEPGNPAYMSVRRLKLTGWLNIAALESALAEIARRHEILRTIFPSQGHRPAQLIEPFSAQSLPIVDLSGLPEIAQEQVVRRLVAEESRRSFTLSHLPLLRLTLLRLTGQSHTIVIAVHHIIVDGWSMNIFARETTQLYGAFKAGEVSPLPELSVQYGDFASWQQNWLCGEALEDQLAYWRRHLTGSVALKLPVKGIPPLSPTFRGAVHPFALPPQIATMLNDLGRREGTTLFMTLLAAFKLLLSRYTGQDDILVGTGIANRNRAEIEPLIGFFVNMLALRTDLSGNPSFRELLKRVREVSLEAYARQDVPFERLVAELRPQWAPERTSLFQVVFFLQNFPSSALELPDVTANTWGHDAGIAHFDMMLFLFDTSHGLVGGIEYNTDLFNSETIERMIDRFMLLLEEVAADPEIRLLDGAISAEADALADGAGANLAILSRAELHQLINEWNDTETEYPTDCSISQRFSEQARRAPDSLALIIKDQLLTYGELERRANQLAHHLLALGLDPESLVGVALSRSPEAIIALLAILKAGAAYLPLDPSLPSGRLLRIVDDASPAAILTLEELVDRLPPTGLPTIRLDADWPLIAREPVSSPPQQVAIDRLAYVCYTSGSTGRPKGVAVSHRGVLRLVCGVDYVHLDSSETLLQAAPLAFDASTFEIWGALLHGARLALYPDQTPTPAGLRQVLGAAQVTTLWLTASLFNFVVDEDVAALNQVRQLLVGGEALSPRHIEQARRQLPQTALINGYGPTEGTTFTCCGEVGDGPIRLGRPIANTQVYVVGRRAEPMACGVAGELWIGGDGLARGYHQDAWQTAEKFAPDGVSGRPGRRLYRSGDLAREDWNGEVEYLGRLDNQVKVRGHRIELEEVENELRQVKGVRGAAARLEIDERGEKMLVGYVVWEAGVKRGWSEVRAEMRQRVPEYMAPGAWVELEELPLNSNGKVDRGKLNGVKRNGLAPGSGEARTAVEELVAGIWAEVLRVEVVGVEDSFFELGGHSLLATQVMSRVREACGVEVELRRLFEEPTVRALARSIEQARRQEPVWEAPRVERGEGAERKELSYGQQRMWFTDRLRGGSGIYIVPGVIRMDGQIRISGLGQSFNEVVRRHEVLRTRIVEDEGEARPQAQEQERLRLLLVDLSGIEQDRREAVYIRLAMEDADRPFDLSAGPLMRLILLRLKHDEHVLLSTMHHIISDNWSAGVFIRELRTHYEAFVNGISSPMPELAIQYADYASWQRRWLQGPALQRQLSYWRNQLANLPPLLLLPTDHPRPRKPSMRCSRRSFLVASHLATALSRLSRREGVTLFMSLLAAFQTLLYRYSGQADICVGSPIANRRSAALEALIGYFINILALRTNLSGNPTFREALRRVREVTLSAYDHQDLPFEQAVQAVRSPEHAPLVQVTFTMQNAPVETLRLPNLTLHPVNLDSGKVEYDMSLIMSGGGEGLTGLLIYDAALFEPATINQMVNHYQRIIEAVVADPEIPLLRIPLSQAHKEQMAQATTDPVIDSRADQFAFKRRQA